MPPCALVPKSCDIDGSDITTSSEEGTHHQKKRRNLVVKNEANELRVACIGILAKACKDDTNRKKTHDADLICLLSTPDSCAVDVYNSQMNLKYPKETIVMLRAVTNWTSGNV